MVERWNGIATTMHVAKLIVGNSAARLGQRAPIEKIQTHIFVRAATRLASKVKLARLPIQRKYARVSI